MDLDPDLLSWMRDERLRKAAECIILCKKPDEGMFKTVDGIFFQHYVASRDRRPRIIQMAPSYLLLVQGKFTTLIGVDEDTGKLFVSGVDYREGYFKRGKITKLEMTYGKVWLLVCEDADVREMLGYHVDFRGGVVDLRGLGVDELRLRVQGDLVLVARGVKDVADFAAWIAYDGELGRYVDSLFLDRVLGTLLEEGFSVRMGWGRRIEVVGVTALRLKKFLATWLRKYFTAVVEEDSKIAFYDQELGRGYLTFDEISVSLHITKYGPIIDKLKAEAVEAFREVGRRRADLSFMVGRHRVSVKSCLPNNVAFNPSIKPTYLGGDRLVFSFREVYAFAGETVITITHPEHERRDVIFKQDAVVRFENTWTHPAFIRMRNRLLLRRLAKAGQEGGGGRRLGS